MMTPFSITMLVTGIGTAANIAIGIWAWPNPVSALNWFVAGICVTNMFYIWKVNAMYRQFGNDLNGIRTNFETVAEARFLVEVQSMSQAILEQAIENMKANGYLPPEFKMQIEIRGRTKLN